MVAMPTILRFIGFDFQGRPPSRRNLLRQNPNGGRSPQRRNALRLYHHPCGSTFLVWMVAVPTILRFIGFDFRGRPPSRRNLLRLNPNDGRSP